MSMRMLIDARHPEETRVAVVKGNRIEEFDFEAAARKQLKGNIYLAKVTRVEPSLQAAFIEYGGNRHGFLAFSEIHPDYYQIPKEDREALLREEREAHAADHHDDHHDDHRDDAHDEDRGASDGDDAEAAGAADGDEHAEAPAPEDAGAHEGDASEALRRKRMNLRRRYKIQDVVRRRQVMLVQVVKEERGNKGAALTTYLSLAGRYCVLMPNTHHGGGISRKISNQADRKRLKSIMSDLQLPAGMGAIVRTAGLSRTKTEIKRDFDYLCRLWDDIREATLASTAPALIHQDSDLIKRAIRDIYSREIDQVLVEGADGHAAAKTFMKLLMPSHARKVQQYSDPVPLFQRFGVEGQLAAMYQPVVQLRSGGYIVINPTEALVSIDINSGRSTREHNIEETATKTNIEAADEIARQLRLRDMAGLVVIDFIDMENNSNVRKVERAMKDALRNDRARIQIGRISSFGLMEMSRQRLRTGVLEASTHTCPMCDGVGLVRSVPSAALAAMRGLEEQALKGKAGVLLLRAASEVGIYILNKKRSELAEIEDRYGVAIEVLPDSDLMPPHFTIEGSGGAPTKPLPAVTAIPAPEAADIDDEDAPETEADDEAGDDGDDGDDGERPARAVRPDRGDGDGEGRGGRRRRRRRRGGRRGDREPGDAASADDNETAGSAGPDDEAADIGAAPAAPADATAETEEERRSRRRRRGRRGGRRRDGEGEGGAEGEAAAEPQAVTEAAPEPVAADEPEPEPTPAKAPRRRRSAKAGSAEAAAVAEPAADAPAPAEAAPEPAAEAPAKPKRASRSRKAAAPAEAVEPVPAAAEPAAVTATDADPAVEPAGPAAANDSDSAADPARPNRRGWWQRTFGA